MSATNLAFSSPRSRVRALASAAALAVFAGVVALVPPAAAVSASVQTDLKVLVLADGATPATAGSSVSAIEQRMADEGVPFTSVSLGAAGRPTINEAFLSEAGHAKYQGIVLYTSFDNIPSTTLSDAEKAAIAAYETNFGIRQLDSYAYPMPSNGLTAPPAFGDKLDGVNATLSSAATTGAFAGLKGPVTFDDWDTSVVETWGYMAIPYSPLAAGTSFTSMMTATIPGTSTTGTLMGVYAAGGREELVVTFPYNYYQTQFRLLASGMIEWVTGGMHLGLYRNFASVHIDDVFSADSRWDPTMNCSPSEGDCGTYVPPAAFVKEILMTPADVTYLKTWQTANNLKLDMVYNAGAINSGETDAQQTSLTNLATALLGIKSDLRWVNHTYKHEYMGCVQNSTVTPWVCLTTNGVIQYFPKANVVTEVNDNITWATTNGVSIDKSELVSGEHSGLKTSPQMAVDNPNFVSALADTGIKVTGSDASRELAQRTLEGGATVTLPRYPMNVFFNTGSVVEAADEYNHMFSNEPGTICTIGCITAPLATATGFDTYIAPLEARNMFSRIVNNDPRPHFAHQSNLTEDRLLYRVLDRVMANYKATISDSAPLVNPTMTQASLELTRQASWKAISGNATAYRKDGQVVIKQGATAGWVPLSATTATQVGTSNAWGEAYAGTRSAWTYLAAGATLTVDVAPNTAPAANFSVNGSYLTWSVDATASKDPEDAPLTYTWDFGDGTATQSGVTASHTYAKGAAGERTIKLTVSDPRGAQNAASKVVTVKAPVSPPTASSTVKCDGLNCTFDASASTDANGTVVAYKWEFGDGAATEFGSAKTVSHTYAVGKTYTVKLWVKDNDGEVSDERSQNVTVAAKANQAPTASFTATCTGYACTFDGSASADPDGTVTTYSWDFGDNSAAVGPKVQHNFVNPGTYQVKLSVTDNKAASGASVQAVSVPLSVVKVKAVKGQGKLYVDVDPNKGKGYWTFRVQQLKQGQWTTGQKVYRTHGKKETRTINFKKGTYRVVVSAKYGFAATTSAAVTLKK